LTVCEIGSRAGGAGESAFEAERAFCRQMCAAPRMPAAPVYGHNDWYYAYGDNSADTMRADAEHVVELSPTGANRPFVVIDDGWQPGRGASKDGAGTWDRGNEKFPDLPSLVADVRRIGGRAGAWIRPLQAPAAAPGSWRLARDQGVLDPTVAGSREKIAADVARLRGWGFELIKHDYSTYDLMGRWGRQMGSALTRDGWTFVEGPGRTTAEVINELYGVIREAAGDSLVIGCNTVGHLSAGRFEMCRIGDDTSGTDWSRTRTMGVNSLAFRAAQHGAFYAADPDCAGITTRVPWESNRQWLDLLSRSGTMLFVSLAPDALGAAQKDAVRRALALAAVPQPLGEPLDWQLTTCPSRWRLMGAERSYDWGFAAGQ
jgi:alpha-galactosidase